MNSKNVLAGLEARVDAANAELAQAGIPEITKIRTIAKYLGMTYGFVWSCVQRRELHAMRCGRVLRLKRAEVARWMASLV